ncbi:hypothetical protein [Ruegeria halocynthiae]|uniref:hypothetical protein n=1 Tax=Ruegeria halocynthiae TaxID=985054 RepID=UPI0012696ACA|nr:hypothetical protein [Ruegeria halocynthiae]
MVIAGSVAAEDAEPLEQRSLLELARGFCGPEVEVLSEYADEVLQNLAEHTGGLDPRIDPAQHAAFDKYAVGVIVMAWQAGDMAVYRSHLANGEPISNDMRGKSEALLSLSECLWLTQEDRAFLQAFVEWGIESGKIPDTATVGALLNTVDLGECIRQREFDNRVLAIDPNATDAKEQMIEIASEIAAEIGGRCDELSKLPFQRKS